MVRVPGHREGGAEHDREKPNENQRELERVAQRIERLLANRGEADRGRHANGEEPFARDGLAQLTQRFGFTRVPPGRKRNNQ